MSDRKIVWLLAAAFVLQAVGSTALKTQTFDEPKHVVTAYRFLTHGDQSLGRDSSPLVAWFGLPLLLVSPRSVHLSAEIPDYMPFFEDREHFFAWSAGRHFLAINRGWKATAVWLLPKLMAIALGGILAVYVYRWSRELFGPRGARLSLLLFAFSPTILGHTRLATPDILFATTFFAATYHLRRDHMEPTRAHLLQSGLACGLLGISRLNGLVYLVSCLPLFLVGIEIASHERGILRSRLLRWAAVLGISMLVLNAGFLFKGSLRPLDSYELESPLMQRIAAMPVAGQLPQPFPEDFVLGVDHTLKVKPENLYYKFLWGEFSVEGWPHYFLVAFLIKTPIPLLCLMGMTAFVGARRRADDIAWMLSPVAVALFYPSFVYRLDIGLRYVLPIYPFLLLLCGSLLAPENEARRNLVRAVRVLAAWCILEAALIFPSYLSYFNQLIGGPSRGHRYLLNSNVGWGENFSRRFERYYEKNPELRALGPYDEELPGLYWVDVNRLRRADRPPFGPDPGRYPWLETYEPIDHFGYEILIYRVE